MAPMPDVPRVEGGLGTFTIERTKELLGAAKKTESRVDGDPLAHMVRRYPGAFAVPVAAIYNEINRCGRWPAKWKTEHLTIIPKVPNPAGLHVCRNISCTSIFSKVLEGIVLKQLRAELEPDPAQYGGTPRCGTEHMLVDIWEEILTAMEGGKSAAVLLGVDYEKAFNRMDHSVCLDKLRQLGASDGSLAMVKAFLEDRCMTITIDGHRGVPVKLMRGSPQGSVLGCLLYCITTQSLTSNLRGETAGPAAYLYVDDTTLMDGVDMNGATRHITTEKTVETFDDLTLARDFEALSGRAEDIGMKINASKTQLLIVSPPNGCTTRASFRTGDGTAVSSVEVLRLVGFSFGSDPGASAHIEALCNRYRTKKWMLYHLREAGFKGDVLFKLYACYIRSILEYCSPVYHSLLTGEQLEKLHRHAIRVCYGFNESVEAIMNAKAIETLEARRIRRVDNFVRKSAANPRFRRWFPPREEVPHDLRRRRAIEESQAQTNRRFNSPLAFFKRRANELGVVR